MKYLLVLVALFSFSVMAEEKPFFVDWAEATHKQNEAEIKPGELIGYRVYYSNGAPATQENNFAAVMPGDTDLDLVVNLEPGAYTFYFAVTALIYGTDYSDPAFPDGKQIVIEGDLQPAPGQGDGVIGEQVALEFFLNPDGSKPKTITNITVTFRSE